MTTVATRPDTGCSETPVLVVAHSLVRPPYHCPQLRPVWCPESAQEKLVSESAARIAGIYSEASGQFEPRLVAYFQWPVWPSGMRP